MAMPAETTRRIAATVTGSGALTAGQHTPVDATAGTVTLALPTQPRYGASLSVEKVDGSTHPVQVTGAIRGLSTALTLALPHQSVEFRADSAGSWWPTAGYTPKEALDAVYATTAGTTVIALTQTQYNALPTPNPAVLYLITQ